jgi:hypothetical protein
MTYNANHKGTPCLSLSITLFEQLEDKLHTPIPVTSTVRPKLRNVIIEHVLILQNILLNIYAC